MRWLEIYLEIKIRNIRKKKYVAVKDPKLHKIDTVNFFCNTYYFKKKLKTKNFEKKKVNTVQN